MLKTKKAVPAFADTAFLTWLTHLLLLLSKQCGNRSCLGMRKNEDQSNDERINTQRLDQGESDQHGHGDFTG